MPATPKGRILLLSGNPRSGRTTVLRTAATAVSGFGPRGMLTEALETDHGDRLGYRLVTFDGREAVVAHRRFDTDVTLGPYGVDLDALDDFVDTALDPKRPAAVWLVDEVSRLTTLSDRFETRMQALLDGDAPIVATVSARGSGFVGKVRRRRDAEVWEVTPENRDELTRRVVAWLEARLDRGRPEAARV